MIQNQIFIMLHQSIINREDTFKEFYTISLGLDDGWNNVILNTENESMFIKAAMAFFNAHYHGRNLLGGSTNQNGGIEFSNYLTSDSGATTYYPVLIWVITMSVWDSYVPQ